MKNLVFLIIFTLFLNAASADQSKSETSLLDYVFGVPAMVGVFYGLVGGIDEARYSDFAKNKANLKDLENFKNAVTKGCESSSRRVHEFLSNSTPVHLRTFVGNDPKNVNCKQVEGLANLSEELLAKHVDEKKTLSSRYGVGSRNHSNVNARTVREADLVGYDRSILYIFGRFMNTDPIIKNEIYFDEGSYYEYLPLDNDETQILLAKFDSIVRS